MTTAAPIMLRATELDAGYRDKRVLAGIDLVVRRGEFWFLVGGNGRGKTTLLHTLLGLIPPLRGRVEYGPALASRQAIGFVPQRCDLNPAMPTTVREFVSLGMAQFHGSAADRRERLTWALDRVGLGGMEHHNYWTLSGGQRQRALVARALVLRPTLLVADEPTAGLDPAIEDLLLRLLLDLNRTDSLTVLFVTHDLLIALRYASHVALFLDGQIQAGPTQEVLHAGSIAAAFGEATVESLRAARTVPLSSGDRSDAPGPDGASSGDPA